MSTQHYIILSGAAVLSILLVWMEYQRVNRRRIIPRCIAVLTAILSLSLLAMPLSWKQNTTTSTGILLTEGYHKDSLALLRSNNNMPVYTPETLLASGDTGIKQWHVLGYGLDQTQLTLFDQQQLYFHPTAIGTGIAYANWQQELAGGQPLVVQGHCINKENSPLQVYLEAYGTIQDSLSIPARTENSFTLKTVPKHSANAVFHLQLKQGKKIIEDNALPVTVSVSKKIRLLVLAASPDFEYRFLRRWLGEAGYATVIRTRTSMDKYEQSYINHAPVALQNLTANTLDSFDVLLSDAAAMDALTETERNTIEQQVSNKGLGLLLRTDSVAAPSRFYMRAFQLYAFPGTAQQKITPRLTTDNSTLPVLPAEQPIGIRSNTQNKTWVEDASGNALAASSLHGTGKIAITTIDNTYQWMLGGQQNSYRAYWGYLLEQLARKENTETALVTPGGFYTKGQSVPLSLTSTKMVLPSMSVNGSVNIPLQQQQLPYTWQGHYRPSQEGWQHITGETSAKDIYIYGASDWPMVKAADRLLATGQWISEHPAIQQQVIPAGKRIRAWWLLALFLLASGFLWVERKYFS